MKELFEKVNRFILLPQDKANHSFWNLLIYSLIAIYSADIAIIVVLLSGIGKEVYDSNNEDIHTPDVMDAVYSIVPSSTVYILSLI